MLSVAEWNVRVKVMDVVKEVVREKNGDVDIFRSMDKERYESTNADSVRVVVCGCFYLPSSPTWIH